MRKKESKKLVKWFPTISATAIFVICVVLLVFLKPECPKCPTSEKVIPPGEAGKLVVDYMNDIFFSSRNAYVENVYDMGSLYKINIKYGQSNVVVYLTKDGKYLFFPEYMILSGENEPLVLDIPKTQKPKIELFVMSYCPGGRQMQATVLPVYRLFGDKVNISVKFVNYIMHGEKEMWENTRQYCIQSINKSLYWDYLECFLSSLNSTACMKKVGINISAVNSCINKTIDKYKLLHYLNDSSTWLGGRYPLYPVYDDECKKLKVRGSPTVFVNGVKYPGIRTPEAFKRFICRAFLNPPHECSITLLHSGRSPGGSCRG